MPSPCAPATSRCGSLNIQGQIASAGTVLVRTGDEPVRESQRAVVGDVGGPLAAVRTGDEPVRESQHGRLLSRRRDRRLCAPATSRCGSLNDESVWARWLPAPGAHRRRAGAGVSTGTGRVSIRDEWWVRTGDEPVRESQPRRCREVRDGLTRAHRRRAGAGVSTPWSGWLGWGAASVRTGDEPVRESQHMRRTDRQRRAHVRTGDEPVRESQRLRGSHAPVPELGAHRRRAGAGVSTRLAIC